MPEKGTGNHKDERTNGEKMQRKKDETWIQVGNIQIKIMKAYYTISMERDSITS